MAITPPLVGDPTLRERIMRVIKRRFEVQQAGVSSAILTWDVVTRLPLTKDQQLEGYAIGIYDTSEKVRPDIGRDERFLNVAMEFHIKLAEDDDPETYLNGVLGEVQRVAQLDLQNKEEDGYALSINMQEKGSELDISGTDSRNVAGLVVFEVHYRTKANNPFRR